MNRIFLLLFILGFLSSCKNDPKPTTTEAPKTRLKVPSFDADHAYEMIQKQVDFGHRYPGTQAHKDLITWMVSELEGLGATVIEQDFKASFLDVKDAPATNIMAQFNPKMQKRVLLAAHFDSRKIAEKDDERQDQPIDGADDGGSGVGVLMEIARLITEHPIGIGVDILLFDAEDQGTDGDGWCLGSQHWSRNIRPRGYKPKYGILLDLVGADKATFGKEGYSKKYAGPIQEKIWTIARNMGYADYFQNFNLGSINDDHLYVNVLAGIPMVDIINHSAPIGKDPGSFGHYHHTHDDNMDVISKRTLKVVGQVVTAVLYNESNGDF